MSTATVLVKFAKPETSEDFLLRAAKLIPGLTTTKKDPDIWILQLPDGMKDLAIFEASFAALLTDSSQSIQVLAVPNASPIFYAFLESVQPGHFTYLYQRMLDHPEELTELEPLLAGFSREMLATIDSYLENGLSPTLASYRLYVHKNTVTYRVKEFEKRSHIDLSLLPNSVLVYLLLRFHEKSYNDRDNENSEN